MSAFKTRRDQTKRLHYDARGREDYHTWDSGAAPGINRVWDDAHRLTSISNAFSTIEYAYDNAGQAKWEKTNVAGSAGPKQLTYYRYPSGEVSRLVYPDGAATVQRGYTARGQLQGVGWGENMSTSYVYHRDGKVDYQAWSNNVLTKYEYDERGMIYSIRHKNAGTNHDLAYREYHRDERDRIDAWRRGIDSFHNGMEDGRGDRYHYDPEGQLDGASYRAVLNPDWIPSEARRGDSFDYDELGNRKGWNDVASRGAMWMVRKNNGLNEYSSWQNSHPNPPLHWGGATNYDDDIGGTWGSPGHANGVLMQDGYITAGFNALNQPMAIWVPAYGWGASAQWMWFGFDPLGRCVKRWMGSDTAGTMASNPATYFYYDGWNLLQEGNGTANNVARVYVHGGRVDEIVASQGGGQWRYHHYDARGHCLLLTSPNGTLLEQYDYDAFGFPYFYNSSGAKQGPQLYGNRFLFTGREWLGDLRLYDYRNRMYQPELGRFLQPDPKQFAAGDYNLYRYCHNDPVNRTDPDGLYGRGRGWEGKDKEWEMFDRAQQAAAARLEKASAKMDEKAFEKAFGTGSATAENMAKVQKTMQRMAAALRDDGTKGYKANAYSENSRIMGRGDVGGKQIKMNLAHPSFGNQSALTWATGHESGHNAGLGHGTANGVTAYKYGSAAERDAYKNLPPADRLGNPDNYMDFAR